MLFRATLFLFFALWGISALIGPAQSAEDWTCNARSEVIDALVAEYDEQLTEVHKIKGKGLLEFHVSPKQGTWTALLTKKNGISCVLAVGEGIDPAKAGALTTGSPI